MKDIKTYIKENLINEEYNEFRVNEIVAVYKSVKPELYFMAPENYNESDLEQYINDLWMEKMPSNEKYSTKFFGKNNDNIYDIYFEYDKYEHIPVDDSKDIDVEYVEFDSNTSAKNVSDDVKLDLFKLSNFRFIMKFDRFDIQDVTESNVGFTLKKLFKSVESNSYNKWPFEMKFDESKFSYTV